MTAPASHLLRAALILAAMTLCACSLPQRAGEPAAAQQRYRQLVQAGAPRLIAVRENRENRFATFARLQERNGTGTWISADDVSLSLWDGFLVATRGLGGDMMSADVGEVQAAVLFDMPGYYPRFQSYLDGENQTVIRSFVCRVSSRGPRRLEFEGVSATTRLMEEDCKSTSLSFVNLYWVDDGSGALLQSRQWASPHLGLLAIRQLPR